MKTKIATLVGLVLVAVGTAFGIATGTGPAIAGVATVVLGAGAAIYGLWRNRNPEKPKWITITTVCLVGAGALITGLSGFHDEKIFGDILGAVIAVVTSIIGVLVNKPKKLIEKK